MLLSDKVGKLVPRVASSYEETVASPDDKRSSGPGSLACGRTS